jgi:hypothetical protein
MKYLISLRLLETAAQPRIDVDVIGSSHSKYALGVGEKRESEVEDVGKWMMP